MKAPKIAKFIMLSTTKTKAFIKEGRAELVASFTF
jgi:hypothetical protein